MILIQQVIRKFPGAIMLLLLLLLQKKGIGQSLENQTVSCWPCPALFAGPISLISLYFNIQLMPRLLLQPAVPLY